MTRTVLDVPYRDGVSTGSHRMAVPHGLREEELIAATATFLARATGVPDGVVGLLRPGSWVVAIGSEDFAEWVNGTLRADPARGLSVVFELQADLSQRAPAIPGAVLLVRVSSSGHCEWHVALPAEAAIALHEEFGAFLDEIGGRCVHQIIAARAGTRPDAPAVAGADGTITFDHLHDRTTRLAGALERHGIGPGDHVGILLPRTTDLVVAALAVMRTGAAWMPLTPTRVWDLTRQAKLVLTDSRLTRHVHGVPRVKMDRLRLATVSPGTDHAWLSLPATAEKTHQHFVDGLADDEVFGPLTLGETAHLLPLEVRRAG